MLALGKGWPAARNKLPRSGLSVALMLVVAGAATACGSDNGGDRGGGGERGGKGGGEGGKSGDSAGVKEAEAAYKAHMGEATWKAPGPAFDASKAAGKTVAYIG